MSEIQFGLVLVDGKGNEIEAEAGVKMTLARACETALDAAIESDRNEGFKPKLRRGRLIEEINTAAASMTPLALEAADVALLKERIGFVFLSASLTRRICLLLDPATRE